MAQPYVTVTFLDNSKEEYEAASFAGGAQGKIYRSRGGDHALKVYASDPKRDAQRVKNIDLLINEYNPTKGDPYWDALYTWPQLRAIKMGAQTIIGYRMRMATGVTRLDHFLEIFGTFSKMAAEKKGWFIGRMAVAMKLVSAANRLANKGLCYSDFSHRNVMVEPFEGRMVLIDCDSLTVPSKIPAEVIGTPLYIDPEILAGKTKIPSVETDRHALAVLLYEWFLGWHPLVGDRPPLNPDPNVDDDLRFGAQALYVEDRTDRSNVAKDQRYRSTILGPEMEKLFLEAFTVGLHHPEKRPQPIRWLSALNAAYDRIIPCSGPSCDWRFFIGSPGSPLRCPRCGTKVSGVATLPTLYLQSHRKTSDPDDYDEDKTRAKVVMGWPGRTLQEWHMESRKSPDYTDSTLAPDRQPRVMLDYDGQQWTWKNLSQAMMRFRRSTDPPKTWQDLPVHATVALEQGMKIQCGPDEKFYRAFVALEKV